MTSQPTAGAAVADSAPNAPAASHTLLLSDAELRSLFSWEEAIEALRAAYARPVDDHIFPRGPWPAETACGCGR